VLTGLIKSNIPSRVSLSVASNVDSRVILDESGAEKLLGNGDLLYKPIGIRKPFRIQSGFASPREIASVVNFLKSEHSAEYSQDIIDEVDENTPQPKAEKGTADENVVVNPDDDLVNQAITIIVQTQNASTAYLQRKLKLGFPRAARIMDEIEEMGIIGPQEGSKPRKIMITADEWAEMQARR
jgi:S-DNA-T family DNA segregation ATPase FtsK/SpoIIIE